MPTASWSRSFGKKAKGRGRGNTGEKGRRGISGHVPVTIPPPQTPTTACVKRFGQAKQQLPEPGKQGSLHLQRKLPFRPHTRRPSRSTKTPDHPQHLSLLPPLLPCCWHTNLCPSWPRSSWHCGAQRCWQGQGASPGSARRGGSHGGLGRTGSSAGTHSSPPAGERTRVCLRDRKQHSRSVSKGLAQPSAQSSKKIQAKTLSRLIRKP